MLRELQIVVPPARSQALLRELERFRGVVGLRFQPGAALKPKGDVVSAQVVCRHYASLMTWLQAQGVGCAPGTSLSSSEPQSLLSPGDAEEIASSSSEASWEEMEHMLGRESNATASGMALMAASGVIASVGLATGALHLVAASMVIAPGFEPLVRIALGACAGGPAWHRGLRSFAVGYLVLIAGAAATAALLPAMGVEARGEAKAYMDGGSLVRYWTQPSLTAVPVSAAGAVAGALLVASNRSVLTSGVMLALALVPSAALVGVGLVAWDGGLTASAALRFMIEVGLVLGVTLAVFGWKRFRTHRRRMMI